MIFRINSILMLLFVCVNISAFVLQGNSNFHNPILLQGVVESFRQEKLAGVHVYTNHNRTGTQTDETGKFSLKVNIGDSVYFKKDKDHTFWSMVADKNHINIDLTVKLVNVTVLKTLGQTKEVVIDGLLYPIDMLYNIPVNIDLWGT